MSSREEYTAGPQVWVVMQYPDGRMELDGAHSPDKDLTRTYAILNAVVPEIVQAWKCTIETDQYGTHWPRFEDVTATLKGTGSQHLPGGPQVANLVRARKGVEPLPEQA